MKNIVIVGMGALGLLFGQQFAANLGGDQLIFLMDETRKKKHEKDIYRINGKDVSFRISAPEDLIEPADLVVIATKYSGLYEARDMIRGIVDENTTIVSLLNGISSEDILAEVYPREQIVDTICIGMDAVRDGTELNYQNMGRWQVGITKDGSQARLDALCELLEQVRIPYEECPDITRAMWIKFMLNVGINQACMVYDATYGDACAPGPICEEMLAAMHEVIDIAEKEGVSITREDVDQVMVILRSLSREGYPSMRQDRLAQRKSEVELFAGAVIRIARKHDVPVPVNESYYKRVQEIEDQYT